jgi:hypothetical protein
VSHGAGRAFANWSTFSGATSRIAYPPIMAYDLKSSETLENRSSESGFKPVQVE